MKAVIDTNVLVSGLLKPYSRPGTIIRQLISGQIQLIYDARIIAEYREVLYRPFFGFRRADVEALLVYIKETGLAVSPAPSPFRLPDPDDEPFLEAPRAETETIIITGNKKHFPPELCAGVKVLSPAEFITGGYWT